MIRNAIVLAAAFFAVPSFAGAAVTGTVTSEGRPVAGATVHGYALELSDARGARMVAGTDARPIATVTTGADGAFRVDQPGVVVVGVRAAGYAPAMAAVLDGEPALVAVARAAPRRGRVTSAGRPVANAVLAWMGAAAGPHVNEWLARTGADGGFEVPDPDSWASSVGIFHPDHAPSFEHPSPKWRLAFTLEAGVPVTGRATDKATGRGVPGATITIDGWPRGRSGADGSFTIAHERKDWTEVEARTSTLVGAAEKGTGPVTVALEPARRLTGTARDAATRRPLAGVVVTVAEDPSTTSAIGVTDASGRYSVEGIAPGRYWIYGSRAGYATEGPDGPDDDMVDLRRAASAVHDLALAPQKRVAGRVQDEQGRPVAGALVTIGLEGMGTFYGSFEQLSGGQETGGQPALSAADGTFTLALPAFVDEMMRGANMAAGLSALKTGFAAGHARMPAAGGAATIVLPKGTAVAGRVTTPDGAAVADAAITVLQAGPLFAMMQPQGAAALPPWTRSDADGRFVVHVNDGRHLLGFRKPGHAPRTVDVADPRAPEPLAVVLDPAAGVSGRVVRTGGRPVAEASVSLVDPARPDESLAATTTDEAGGFTLSDLAAGRYELRIAHREGVSAKRPVQAPAEGVTVEVPAGGTLRGRVVDAGTRAPVPRYQVRVWRQPRPGIEDDFADGRSEEIDAADGVFTVESVPPGATSVLVAAEGYRNRTLENVAVSDAADAPPLEIALEPGVTLRGRVTADGSGLADAGVSAGNSENRHESGATTDENGDYELKGLPRGEVEVRVAKAGYQSVRRTVDAQPGARLDVALTRGLALSGVVVADEKGVAKARVTAFSGALDADAQSAVTDESGRFSLTGLSAARYTVRAISPEKGQAEVKDLDVATAGIVRLVIDRSDRAVVTGTVTGASTGDGPPPIVMVYVRNAEGRAAYGMADAAGAFRIEDAPAGHVTAVAAAMTGGDTRSSAAKELTLAAGSETAIVLEFKDDAVLTGTVTRMGLPVPAASVAFQAPADMRAASTRTDPDGRYRLGLPAGSYRVSVTGERLSYATEIDVRESAVFDIDVTGGAVRGRAVDAASGAPVAGVEVALWLEGRNDGPRDTETTSAEGTFEAVSLREGRYRVVTSKKGYGQATREVDVTRGASADVVLPMQPADGITVSVTDARGGHPLQAIVVVRDAERRIVANRHAGADAEGSVTIPLADGAYLLSTSATGYGTATLRVTAPARGLKVALTPGGTLVVESAQPLTGKIRLLQPDGEEYVQCWCNGIAEIKLDGRRTSVEHVTPGSYTLELVGVPGKSASLPVVVQEGQVTTVTID